MLIFISKSQQNFSEFIYLNKTQKRWYYKDVTTSTSFKNDYRQTEFSWFIDCLRQSILTVDLNVNIYFKSVLHRST
jgi:hypothetical protein